MEMNGVTNILLIMAYVIVVCQTDFQKVSEALLYSWIASYMQTGGKNGLIYSLYFF